MEPGDCVFTDNGLGSWALVRRTDCANAHDLRVFGQVRVEESSDGMLTEDDGYEMVVERCGDKYDSVPRSWVAGARPSDYHYTDGNGTAGGSANFQDEASSTVKGTYTCYVRTS